MCDHNGPAIGPRAVILRFEAASLVQMKEEALYISRVDPLQRQLHYQLPIFPQSHTLETSYGSTNVTLHGLSGTSNAIRGLDRP